MIKEESMEKGIFITFEGPDGAGKSTQIDYLKKYFDEKGIPCIFTREPGGTSIGEALRKIILDPKNSEMNPMTETLLYAACRAQHVSEKIRPALESGIVVVCDRFIDSSIAYQGYARGLGEKVKEINQYAVMDCIPDLTFFIDTDPKVGKNRIKAGDRDRLEKEKLNFHRKVYQGYLELAKKEHGRIISIDGSRSKEDMRNEIILQVEKKIRESFKNF